MKLLAPIISIALATMAIGAEPGGQVRTEFVTLSLGKNEGPFYYRNDGEIATLSASSKGIGAAIAYNGSRLLSLYGSPDGLTERQVGETVPKPVAQVRLPFGEDRVLLMFSNPGGIDKDAVTLNATGISSDKMKAGDYRLFNMSKQQVLVVMNEQKAVIEPRSIADVSDASWKSDVIDMQVQLGVKDEGGPRRVYSSVWGHRPGRRTFLFIFDRSDEFRPVEIRCYYDVPRLKEPGPQD